MIRKTFTKLVYGLKTKLHESGKRHDVIAFDRRVDLQRGGEGAPLLYLHSLIGETRWLPFHQKLARTFDVIAPAHPGLGGTESAGIDSIEDVAFHYLDLLDALELRNVNLVGVSFGGWIAAELAVRAPERFGRLVLVDAFGLEVADAPAADVGAIRNDVRALRSRIFAEPDGPMAEIALPFKAGSDRAEAASRTVESATQLSPLLGNAKLERRLRRIVCPTLVMWGDRDRVVPLAHAEVWRDRIEGAKLVVLDGCGHLPPFEAEDRFVDAVTEFCASPA